MSWLTIVADRKILCFEAFKFTIITDWNVFSVFQALGCILYLLCYKQHPFEDSAKLRILNGKYIIPESVVDYSIFHDMLSE